MRGRRASGWLACTRSGLASQGDDIGIGFDSRRITLGYRCCGGWSAWRDGFGASIKSRRLVARAVKAVREEKRSAVIDAFASLIGFEKPSIAGRLRGVLDQDFFQPPGD